MKPRASFAFVLQALSMAVVALGTASEPWRPNIIRIMGDDMVWSDD